MNPSFRDIIRRECERRGISAYRLAQLSGESMRTAQQYLSGSNDTAGERVARFAAALGLELRLVRTSASDSARATAKRRTNKKGGE